MSVIRRKNPNFPKLPEKHAKIRTRILDDFPFYSMYVKGRKLQKFHIQWCRKWVEMDDVFLTAPRGCWKSSILIIDYTEWLLINDYLHSIMQFSNGQDVVEGNLAEIKGTLTKNERFLFYFGNFQGQPWRIRKADVKGRPLQKDNSIMICGVPGSLAEGLHADTILFDDTAVAKNTKTPNQRKSVIDFLEEVVPGMWKPETTMKGVGTFHDPNDLHAKFVEEGGWFYDKHIPVDCFVDDDEKVSWWPERYPLQSRSKEIAKATGLPVVKHGLMDYKEKMGTARFEAQMRSRLDKLRGTIIKDEWLQNFWYETGRPPFCLPTKNFLVFEGVDLAISESLKAAYFVWLRIVIDRKYSNVYVERYIRDRIPSAKKQREIIEANWYQGFMGIRARRIYIEAHGYESSISQDIIAETILPVKKVHHQLWGNAYERQQTLSPMCENGKLFLNPHKHTRLRDELLSDPGEDFHDCMDALFSATRGITTNRIPRVHSVKYIKPDHRIFSPRYGENPPVSLLDT